MWACIRRSADAFSPARVAARDPSLAMTELRQPPAALTGHTVLSGDRKNYGGRGESDAASLLAYNGVPLFLTTDDGFITLASDDQVVAILQQQVDGIRAADFDHKITVLNSTSALYHGTFSRQRRDGSEINRPTLTYLVTAGPPGRRISVLAVHSS